MLTRRHMLASAGAVVLNAATGVANAESSYANQPVHILVGYAAGGGVDIIARLLQEPMKAALGQPIIVENRTGASAMLATGAVAKAAPDGYTLLACASGEVAINHFLFKERMSYDPAKELVPIALVGIVPCVVVVAEATPVHNPKELIAYIRANPGKLSFSSSGIGNPQQLAGELMNTMAGTQVLHVPYRGSAPALQDLMAGRIDYLCDAVSTELSPIKAASVRPIAMLTMRRTAVLPDVPTAKEQGFAVDANNWIGLFFPRGTPDPIIHHLRDATVAAMNTPALRARMETIGTDLVAADRTSSSYLQHYVASEIKKWATPIKESGVTVD